jgi:hypothetical protein
MENEPSVKLGEPQNPHPGSYDAFALQRDQSLFRSHLKLCNLSVEMDWTAPTDPSNSRELVLTREGRYEYLIFMNTFFAADPSLR